MGLIKAELAPSARLAAFSMADIERHAKAILLRARAKADQILQETQIAAEDLRRRAHTDGLAEGFDEGVAKGMEEGGKLGHEQALNENRAQMTAMVESLVAAMSELNEHRQEMEAAVLRDVIALSVKIAERITKRQGQLDPTVVIENVTEALHLVTGAHDVRIAIHPRHRGVLDDVLPRLKLQFPTLQHVELVEDEAMAPGGCRLFTRQGLIDGDLDVQLDRIASELLPSTSQEAN